MFLRTIAVLTLGVTMVAVAGGVRSATSPVGAQAAGAQSSFTIDSLFASYRSGDFAVLDRTLTRPRDFQTLMRRPDAHELDGWLREWHRGKSIFLLELASGGFRVAPPYAGAVIQAARTFLMSGSESDSVFASEWHRTAIAVLEGNGNPALIEEYADAVKATSIGKPPAGLVADRLMLARAVAQERRCWDARPTLEQPGIRLDEIAKAAGAKVPPDLDNPVPVSKAQLEAHKRCLQEAFARFESAAAFPGVHAEAHVRGGWILFLQSRPQDALTFLDAARPGDDRELTYWQQLFRGRALGALGRGQDSADAYRAAIGLYPGAQSAGVGLALQLFAIDQASQADDVARTLRRGVGQDPWSIYPAADRRFIGDYLARLRKGIE